MFHKSDGSSVWLRSSSKLSYLTVSGVIDTPEEYAAIRPRLCQAYDPIAGISAEDAFLVRELDDGALIFCSDRSKNCALLMVGSYEGSAEPEPGKRKPGAVVETFFSMIQDSVDAISSQVRVRILVNAIKPETAIRAN